MAPELCILGVGRSGSGYIAAALNAAGVHCGHEAWWNPQDDQAEGLDADSSWLALGDLGDFNGNVAVQHRHPLLTIASLTQSPDHGGYLAWREAVIGPLPASPLAAATLSWLKWTALSIEVAEVEWRVEDVTAERLRGIARWAGQTVRYEACEQALAVTPLNVNDHSTLLSLTWDDLPDGLRGPARRLAARIGYS